jgi:urate oxidase
VSVVRLGDNRYGKAEVRVVRISRGAAPDGGDVVRDRSVSTALSGDLAATHVDGDNTNVLATDTQKNTVNVFAKQFGDGEPEELGIALAAHFVVSQKSITRARVAIEEYGWTRVGTGRHSFHRNGDQIRTTTVVHDADQGTTVVSGVADLVVMNTSDSEFWGFPRDAYTTLAETNDRILATSVTASWRYRSTDVDWSGAFAIARETLLSAFADTYSYSLQQTLYAMGSQIIELVPDICEVRLTLPNKHHFLVDLAPFGLTNDNEVYYAADRPYGLIEGTVLADDAPEPGLAWT